MNVFVSLSLAGSSARAVCAAIIARSASSVTTTCLLCFVFIFLLSFGTLSLISLHYIMFADACQESALEKLSSGIASRLPHLEPPRRENWPEKPCKEGRNTAALDPRARTCYNAQAVTHTHEPPRTSYSRRRKRARRGGCGGSHRPGGAGAACSRMANAG